LDSTREIRADLVGCTKDSYQRLTEMTDIIQLTPEQVEAVLEDLKNNDCVPEEGWDEVREELLRYLDNTGDQND